MAKTAAEMLRDGMIRHGIKAEDLMEQTRKIAAQEAEMQTAIFLQGGPISINVAMAMIQLIVQSKGQSNG